MCPIQYTKDNRGGNRCIFKKKLDKWLRDIPDTRKINDYDERAGIETESIVHQKYRRMIRKKY